MTDPRYVPRSFLIEPRDFGRRSQPLWHVIDESWSLRRRAQLDASVSQHNISLGVRELYLEAKAKQITDLAREVDVEYNRLQKMLAGVIIMQMEDLARLRLVVGTRLDVRSMRGEARAYVEAVERDFYRRKAQRRGSR